jgi:hypothetical protein
MKGGEGRGVLQLYISGCPEKIFIAGGRWGGCIDGTMISKLTLQEKRALGVIALLIVLGLAGLWIL